MHRKRIVPFSLLSIFILLVINSCNEPLTDFGIALLPDSDGMIVKADTIKDLRFRTVISDSVITSYNYKPLIGEISHNIFGKTKSVLVTQFRNFNYRYNEGFTDFIDANLVLAIDTLAIGIYKETFNTDIRFNVYWLKINKADGKNGLNDNVKFNNYLDYYSNDDYLNFFNSTPLISSKEVKTIRKGDGYGIGKYLVKIPLPETFYSELKNYQDSIMNDINYILDTIYDKDGSINYIDYNYYKLDSAFIMNFGALAIEAEMQGSDENNSGVLLELDLGSGFYNKSSYIYGSRLEVNYLYNDTSGSSKDSSFQYLMSPLIKEYEIKPKDKDTIIYINGRIVNYTYITNEYSNFPINNYIGTDNTDYCFIHSLLGLKTEISIDGLDSLFEGYDKVIINSADLYLEDVNFPIETDFNYYPKPIWCGDSLIFNYEILNDDYAIYFNNRLERPDSVNTNFIFRFPHLMQDYIDSDKQDNIIYMGSEYPLNSGYYTQDKYEFEILNPKLAKLIITYAIP